ncbi:unnamed protein product [Nezara viridula]|uniref:Uncharacterized protein n=1 Tax=Nezara viridula TaxID=85310 RepID=A0A9P0E8S3_NEZVI|nr:unnamed protein product [Nezara viridula]
MCINENNREEPYLYQLIGWVPRNSQKMRGLVYSTDGGSSSWNLVDVPGLIILHVPVYKPVRPVRLTGEGNIHISNYFPLL